MEDPGGVPEGYELRPMRRDDYRKGIVELMGQLTDVGALSEERFVAVFDSREQGRAYQTVVVEHIDSQRLAATATLLIEEKFVHGGASVGHVEDVVVCAVHRSKGLARLMLAALAEHARHAGCYKVILDCNEKNVGMYERCGYRRCEVQMRLDVPSVPSPHAAPEALAAAEAEVSFGGTGETGGT
mmetsp:Transcript_123097/g.230146  ORF Transcript_123097/g.230146 Transcript_123097/m.230146 type:complete len:185 (-) Transcript_123097:138-692(-)